MKLIILLAIISVVQLAGATVGQKPIILVANFDWLGTRMETIANMYLEEGDYIVYPDGRGTIGSFRSDKYTIDKKKVLLGYFGVPGLRFLNNDYMKKQEGIGGLYSKITDDKIYFNGRKYNRNKAKEFCEEKGQSIIYRLERKILLRKANMKYLASSCDGLVVIDQRALKKKRDKMNKFYKEMSERAKSYNPDIKLYAGISLKLENNSAEEIITFMNEINGFFDGFVLEFKYSDDHITTISDILRKNRTQH